MPQLDMKAIKKDLIRPGLKDFLLGLSLWKMCFYLGYEDVRQRYVRTFLGPLWLVIGTAVWIGVMSFVMASLFDNSVASTVPFIAAGMLVWTFIANTMNDGCVVFMSSANIIHSLNLPMSLHILRFVIRNFIIFAHNFVIVILFFLFCHVHLTINTLFVLPALVILLLNAVWIGAFFGIINTRYRDIQQVITTSMTILPFVTPIFWEKGFLKKHDWIANANPFYHAIEIVRAALLGKSPPLLSWMVMLAITVVGLFFMCVLFSKYKNRIIYWL